jgi:hypothetical protein
MGMTVQQAIQRAEALLPGHPAPEGGDDRWQAIIDVAEFVETNPEELWTFVHQWGSDNQEDLRDAIATCLLEHLLELHFDAIFPRVEQAAQNSPLLADTFRRCWKLGQAELPENAARFEALKQLCDAAR